MKLVALTSAALLAATTAFAGNYNTTVPVDVPVVEEVNTSTTSGSLGGSAGWLVPLIAIALIAVAVAANQKDKNKK